MISHIGIGSEERILADKIAIINKYVAVTASLHDHGAACRIAIINYLLSLDSEEISLVEDNSLLKIANNLSYTPFDKKASIEIVETSMRFICHESLWGKNRFKLAQRKQQDQILVACQSGSEYFLRNSLIRETYNKCRIISALFERTIPRCNLPVNVFEDYGVESMQMYLYNLFTQHALTQSQ